MRLVADRGLRPAHALDAGDDADLLGLGFEDRTLLDVQLEERRQRMGAAALRPAIADRLERLAEADPGAVGPRRLSRVNTPPNTPDAIIAGAKREPSSLVQLMTSIGAGLVAGLDQGAQRERPSTPSTPSNLPPVGWVSRWLPMAIGGTSCCPSAARTSRPCRRP